MSVYRETSEEEESFYVDSFGPGQQIGITAVVRQIGGQVMYDRDAYHLNEQRARYKITLPPGCVHTGQEAYMSPQTIILPGGPDRRKLCLYPASDSVRLSWLPGDSQNEALWDHSVRRPDFSTPEGARAAHEALARLSEEARQALAELDEEAQAFKERYAREHGVEPDQIQLFVVNESWIEPVIRPKKREPESEDIEPEQKEEPGDEEA